MANDRIVYEILPNGKYVLTEKFVFDTWIENPGSIFEPEKGYSFIVLFSSGLLTLYPGFVWDGATKAIDTKTFMKPSLVHDSLYLLLRKKKLPMGFRRKVDKLLFDMCIAEGMPRIRALWVYAAVSLFGKNSALPSDEKEFYET